MVSMKEDATNTLAPRPLTMDRLGERDELILAQSTSQCCRCCCFQPSINWVVAEGNNFEPGTNPYALDSVGWIHEESGWCDRTWSWILPGCRATKYVQHSGPPPASIMGENQGWFTCQTGDTPTGLEENDRQANVVAIHEKKSTCGHCWTFMVPIPICNCVPSPYLETTNAETGQVVGMTLYVCDMCCFVPKYDIFDASGNKIYRLRPDTCIAGCCVQCRCDGKKGKCFRVPFYLRDPNTFDQLATAFDRIKAQVDVLWAGWKHECCTKKNAYHIVFPMDITTDQKLVIMGSNLLVDITMFEQEDDDN